MLSVYRSRRRPPADSAPAKHSSITRTAIRDTVLAQATGLILPQVLFQGGVISLLVLSLGGSDFEIGLIFTVANLSAIVQLFAAPYVDVSSRKRMLHNWLMAGAIAIAFIILIYPIDLIWGPAHALWFLLALVLAYSVAVNTATAAWFPLLTELIPVRIRGRFFGRMRMLWQLTAFLVTLLSGWFLGSNPNLVRFYLVFTLGIVFHFTRLYFIRRLPDPPPLRRGKPESLFRNLGRPLRDLQFRRFLVLVFLTFGLNAATMPFVIPYLKLDLGFPTSLAVYASACIAFGSVLSLVWWGKLADRWGSRFVFLLSIATTAAAFVIFAITPSHAGASWRAFFTAAFGFTMQGVGASGLGIGHTVRMMYEAPSRHRGPYMALVAVAIGVFTGIGPLVSGLVLEHLPAMFAAAGVEIVTKRMFFLVLAVLLLGTTPLVRRLRPIAELRTREIVKSLVYTLPSRLGSQMLVLGRGFGGRRTKLSENEEELAEQE